MNVPASKRYGWIGALSYVGGNNKTMNGCFGHCFPIGMGDFFNGTVQNRQSAGANTLPANPKNAGGFSPADILFPIDDPAVGGIPKNGSTMERMANTAMAADCLPWMTPSLESPTTKVKKPRFDNKRARHLTEAEAAALLAKIKEKSVTAYQQTVLSLYAGLRFGEIVSLTWGDVDLDRGILTLRDTKSGRTRAAFITEKIRTEVFDKLEPGRPDDPVFPSRSKKGVEHLRISPAFREAVNELDINKGITDPRMKVCFHTCRHTFASWLVERGTDLFQVSKLRGHSTIALTERYSHLRPDTLQAAVKVLDQAPSATVVNLAEVAEGEK